VRPSILAAARELARADLSGGTTGNVSARVPGGFVITPSGVPYADLQPADLVAVQASGGPPSDAEAPVILARPGARGSEAPAGGRFAPSSEWRMHAGIYAARPDAQAIVHAHPPHATALACLREDIPAFHYLVTAAGGADIRCSAYATFGTAALAEAAVVALEDRSACLLANHGIVTLGSSPGSALDLAALVENLARTYCAARAIGDPALLTADEVAQALRGMRAYRAARAAPAVGGG
jgi:L-fuculose-phosphate aldolase